MRQKKMPEYMSDKMPEDMSHKMPHGRPNSMPDGMSEYMPDNMSAGGGHSKICFSIVAVFQYVLLWSI